MEQYLGGDMSAPVIDVRVKLCYSFPCQYDTHAVKDVFVIGNGRYHDRLINVGTTGSTSDNTPLARQVLEEAGLETFTTIEFDH